ncbi:DNA alkylation repair protein [Listeria floridensis]|uniref:DNA alkylation repair protein n=1 Tax=Listeria floridensis TaxID=1494962 RepID=UPI00056C3B70
MAELKEICYAKRDEAGAAKMEAYMRNQFSFLGIRAPERKQILKTFLEQAELDDFGLTLAVELYQEPEREFQYLANDLLGRFAKKQDADAILVYEKLITMKSWWDTVDSLASSAVGKHFQKYPELIEVYNAKWLESDNIWLNRTTLIFQLSYKEKTDANLLFANCARLAGSDEFFIQKAIGWGLRQYAKVDPEAVRAFVEQQELAPLSKREALKHLNELF